MKKQGSLDLHVIVKMGSEVNFRRFEGNVTACENDNEVGYIPSAIKKANSQ